MADLQDERIGSEAAGEPTEAELRDVLAAMSAPEAEATLLELASALFPAQPRGVQVTWPETDLPAAPRVWARGTEDEAAAKLRAAELRYRTLVEQIPAVTFMAVLGEGENEIYVSPHIQALLGFTQKEWLDNPFLWFHQLHPDDRALWIEEFARGCRTGGPFRAECRFIARDGRVVWVRGEARLVKDDRGRPFLLQGVAFDITDSKKAETILLREAVRTTEERYRDLVEQLGAIFWEADPETGRFTFVSRGAERMLGFPADRWIEAPQFWAERIHPEDRPATESAWAQARAGGGSPSAFEYRAVTASGRTVWLHQKAHTDTTGPQRRLLGVIIDITDRKNAEEVLRANEARLKTESAIRGTLQRIGTALAGELQLDRVIQLATDEATALTTAQFGAFFYNVADEQGQRYTLYTLSGVPRDAFAQFPMPRNTPLFAPTFTGQGIVRLDDVAKDPRFGKTPPYHGMPPGHLPVRSYLAVPVVSRGGEVLGGMFFGHAEVGVFTQEHESLAAGIAGWTALAIDNAQLYSAAQKAREGAESANRAKDEFLATMSHELRTPLNAVLGWTMILRTSGSDEVLRHRALDTIERNARTQAQIIEDLLDVSRIVTGKLRLDVTTVDLAHIIDAVLDSTRLAADAKRLTMERDIDRSGVFVAGDSSRLHQIVANLLTNAIKFTPAGGRVTVRLDREADMARVTVADTGQGIAPEFLPHVFERFRQADSSTTRTHGGLGLGLAIVRHLVDLHGGSVHAESAGVGQGATFRVEIPLLADGTAEAAARGARLTSYPPLPLEGVRVLVVEDEPDARDLLRLILERAGAVVTMTQSAAEALNAVESLNPQVLVSDIGMPGIDGYELVRLLRQRSDALSRLPAVAVTAYARSEDRERALAAGYQAHVPKPIVPRDLVSTIEHLASTRE